MPRRDWPERVRRFVVRRMISFCDLARARRGRCSWRLLVGVQLGESAIGQINPIYFQGPPSIRATAARRSTATRPASRSRDRYRQPIRLGAGPAARDRRDCCECGAPAMPRRAGLSARGSLFRQPRGRARWRRRARARARRPPRRAARRRRRARRRSRRSSATLTTRSRTRCAPPSAAYEPREDAGRSDAATPVDVSGIDDPDPRRRRRRRARAPPRRSPPGPARRPSAGSAASPACRTGARRRRRRRRAPAPRRDPRSRNRSASRSARITAEADGPREPISGIGRPSMARAWRSNSRQILRDQGDHAGIVRARAQFGEDRLVAAR